MAEAKKKRKKAPPKDPGFLPGAAAGVFVLVVWGVVAFQPDGAGAAEPARAAEKEPVTRLEPPPAPAAEPSAAPEAQPAVPSWKQDERWKQAGQLGEDAIDKIDAANAYHEKEGDPFRLAEQMAQAKEMFEEAFGLLDGLAADYADDATAQRQIETRRKRFEKKLRFPRR